jgi:hypothetical protein
MGQSAGRSAGNQTNGVRRATQRERDAIDPPGRSEWGRSPGSGLYGDMRGPSCIFFVFLVMVLVAVSIAVLSDPRRANPEPSPRPTVESGRGTSRAF